MSMPALPSASTQQQDARGMLFQVLLADGTTWQEIEAITEFSIDRSEGEETADTTVFQDAGNAKSERMQRGAQLELTARRKSNTPAMANPGLPTPGRGRIEALDKLLGLENIGRIRFRHIWETKWEAWDARVTVGEVSGETNDKIEWECTFVRWGAEWEMAAS